MAEDSIATPWTLPVDRFRVLASYHYYRNVNIGEMCEGLQVGGRKPDVFADSGAFSAWTQGSVIEIDEYAAWIHKWRKHLSVYCNLDVINDPKGSARNQAALESNGLSPLPVWHIRSDWDAFHELLDRYRYVAIGGMVGTPWQTLMPKLVKAMQKAHSAGVAVHGLGLTSRTPLERLPFFSVDSSSWGSGFRYGSVWIWVHGKQRMAKARLGDGPTWQAHRKDVEALGFDPAIFARREASRSDMAAVSALSMGYWEQSLRKRFSVELMPGTEPETRFASDDGLKMLLVDGAAGNLQSGARGLRLFLVEGSSSGRDMVGAVARIKEGIES